MSGLIASAKPYRIKAAHRRRRRAAVGLFVQRYYDPGIGRFLSVDPVTANGVSGSNFNRYWYANNNPYKFTDPDGRIAVCAIPAGPMQACITAAVWLGSKAWIIGGGLVTGIVGLIAINAAADAPESDSEDEPPQYPANPDDWVPPDGWAETNAGEKTGGKHRQWTDKEGRIKRRWDRQGRENGKERGPHWHDADDSSGGRDHIEPDDAERPEERPEPEPDSQKRG